MCHWLACLPSELARVAMGFGREWFPRGQSEQPVFYCCTYVVAMEIACYHDTLQVVMVTGGAYRMLLWDMSGCHCY